MNSKRQKNVANPASAAPLKGLTEVRRAIQGQDAETKSDLPPVHLWNPPYCGEIPMVIKRDGTWHYQNSPIGRKPMVRLFSSILRKDDDRFYLVTPVEKCGIEVEDAPFLAVELSVTGSGSDQILCFRTQVDDQVMASKDHPIWVDIAVESGEPSPYVMVRAGLAALINRPVFYQLVELGVEREQDGIRQFGVWSSGAFFALGSTEDFE